MAIHKKVPDKSTGATPGATKDITLPAFSYQSDRLADLIIAAWANGKFTHGSFTVPKLGDALKDRDTSGLPTQKARDTAKAAVNFFANMDLKSAVVITEDEHDADYTMVDPDEVVFVLPRDSRLTSGAISGAPYAPDLLETAKLLMACTPNGI